MQVRAIFTILLALTAQSLFGQTAYWSPPSGTLQKDKVNMLELHLENCTPSGLPTIPDVPNLQIQLRNRASSQSTFNGRATFEYIITYAVTPSSDGSVVIPGFTVETSEGPIAVAEARYELVSATVGNTSARPEDIFSGMFQTFKKDVYQGEVFQIEYVSGIKQGYQLVEFTDPVWNPTGLVNTKLLQTQEGNFDRAGQRYFGRAYVAEASAPKPGSITLPAVEQNASIVVGRRRGFPFADPVVDTFSFKSETASITVKPLPDGAPKSFNNAVGNFTFTSRVVPENVQVGEPVTWTLELAGKGNWPSGIGIPPRQVAQSFKAIQPQLKNEFADGSLFQGKQTEDIVLIPTKAGRFELGPLEYSYFDPEKGSYQTVSIPVTTVVVSAISGAGTNDPKGTTNPNSPSDQETATDLSPTGKNLAKQPPSLPREPIVLSEARSSASIPTGEIHPENLLYGGAAALALWVILAACRAIRIDPAHPRRKAFAELRKLSRETPQGSEQIKDYQIRWRASLAASFGIESDEPSASEVAAAAPESQGLAWKELWQESDRILFAANSPDFNSWKQRFATLLATCPKARASVSTFFSLRAWALASTIAMTALLAMPGANAATLQASPEQLYQKGDFKGAAKIWEDAAQSEPGDWTHRYNVGLAAAQQENWGKAWAWWASAYALDPSDPRLVWNLKLAHSKTGAYYPTLVDLVDGEGIYALVSWQSPAGWEGIARNVVWLAGILLCLAVVFRYVSVLKRVSSIAFLLALVAGSCVFAAQWMHTQYGLLAESQAVLLTTNTKLLSAPTELGTDQATADLAEGSIGRERRRFLKWVKVEMPNGDIGWLRQETVIPLYGPPKAAD